jgi:hypothetical protein
VNVYVSEFFLKRLFPRSSLSYVGLEHEHVKLSKKLLNMPVLLLRFMTLLDGFATVAIRHQSLPSRRLPKTLQRKGLNLPTNRCNTYIGDTRGKIAINIA